ncbi:MAG: ATP-grasp domain-containing protein [Microgenomates group bacterium]
MKEKIKLAVFTAKNIATSTGSTNTVLNLIDSIDDSKVEINIVTIDNIIPPNMVLPAEKLKLDPSFIPFSTLEANKKISGFYEIEKLTLIDLKKIAHCAIVAIYNTFGEDGKILGFLELAEIPYMSPSLKTSALCFDKQMTKSLLRGSMISVPKGFEVHKINFNLTEFTNMVRKEFSYPVIIKTTSSGASRGISMVNSETDLSKAVDNAFLFSDEFIVEEFISGQEFSIGIMGHYLDPKALPVVEIKSKNQFFDFEAKYTTGMADEICPAVISHELASKIEEIALKSYKAVKATDHARIDIMHASGKLYVLEINTFPGLTLNSIFPKELKAVGSSLSQFIEQSILQTNQKIG